MIAAAHVNVHYLLILLLPSVAACVALAVTWYYRAKRRRETEAKRLSRSVSGARRRGSGAKPRDGAGTNGRSAGAKPRSGSSSKRRD